MNLLFIFTDEQGQKTLRTYGCQWADTPALDGLADESVVFENAYVSQPVCTPSRATIMTGLTPHTANMCANNIRLSDHTPCFTELADFSNTRSTYIGKWHLGDEVFKQHGFDEWVSIEDNYQRWYSPHRDKHTHSSYTQHLIDHKIAPERVTEEGHPVYSRKYCSKILPREWGKPEFIVQKTCEFLEQNRKDPFICYVNFLEPHMPFTGPLDEYYDPCDIPLPENFLFPGENEPVRLRTSARNTCEKGGAGEQLKTEADWRSLRARYYGLVRLVDESVGRILKKLKTCGLDEDTIVVFTSDHGDMMGSHRLVAKTVMYEESVKVPLMFKIPGVKPKRITDPVGQIDIVPTLLDLFEKEVPQSLEGQSLKPSICEDQRPLTEDVLIEWHPNANNEAGGLQTAFDRAVLESSPMLDCQRAVVTRDGYKYVWSLTDLDQLFDLTTDPYELYNRASYPAYAGVVDECRQKIRAWQTRTNDDLVLPC